MEKKISVATTVVPEVHDLFRKICTDKQWSMPQTIRNILYGKLNVNSILHTNLQENQHKSTKWQ